MIYLGTDIIDIDRIRNNLIKNQISFLSKIFTDKEIKYCNSKSDPAIHFAGRFAGKEAVKKAVLSSGILAQLSMKEIEIISSDNVPQVILRSVSQPVSISISHTDSIATATAILIDG